MPASKQDKIRVTCPHCGHAQAEPRTAISTLCKKCSGHFLVQDALRPAVKKTEKAPERKRITCFDCGAEIEVPLSAESSMCKRCSSYVDLKDYHITSAVSKNFKTKGAFVVEPKGYVFNTEAVVGDAVLKGRFLGKLFAEHSLTIYSSAEIKGSLQTGRLIIPAENHFRWKETLKVGAAEIAGELANDLHADGTIILRSTARMFGDIEAKNLVVEAGAVLVGHATVKP
jgi:cytoskeletal protein CcmA (bactofilin family)/DNA-directed RNA polymerase subunit RPC12/RpoP